MQMQLAAPTTDEDIRDHARAFPRERPRVYVIAFRKTGSAAYNPAN